jgi:hypothetical protein
VVDAEATELREDAFAAIAVFVVVAFEQLQRLAQRAFMRGERLRDFGFERICSKISSIGSPSAAGIIDMMPVMKPWSASVRSRGRLRARSSSSIIRPRSAATCKSGERLRPASFRSGT